MRIVGSILGLAALVLVALWFSSVDEPEPGSTVRLKLRRGQDVLLLDVVRATP